MSDDDDVRDKKSLAAFVRELAEELARNPKAWENRDLPAFLGAMAAWIDDMDGYYTNMGEEPPAEPTFETIADILMAATMYE